ncbi:hypothetical protein PENTCL1PPCAC_22328, partial [Pristionchus entomophagus]
SMSYSPLSPPHSNRILSCLCNGKTKKVLFYLGLKFLIVGMNVEERTRIFEETANKVSFQIVSLSTSSIISQSCLLPNRDLFLLHSLDLPRCSHSEEDWLWVTVNGDVLPRERREASYCKKRRNRDEPWVKLRFGERIRDYTGRFSLNGGINDCRQNFLWKISPEESVKMELQSIKKKNNNLLIFDLSPIGKTEFRQRFRSTIIWLKNNRPYTELKNVHAASEQYYIDGMFRDGASESDLMKKTHATLIIDRENGRNLSRFAHHYGFFRYPDFSTCLHSHDQHSKSLTVLTDFLSSYRSGPHFASVHLSLPSGSDLLEMDTHLSSWFHRNNHLLNHTTIVITAGGSSLLDSSSSFSSLIDARLPFLALSASSPLEKSQEHSNLSSSFVSSLEFFSSYLLGKNYRSMNCLEAGIGEEYCMCVEKRGALMSPSGVQEVVEIVDSIIIWINEKTLKYRFICETVMMDEIIEATKISISPEALRLPIHGKSDRYFIEEDFTQYTIQFTIKPGRRLFEATVIYFSVDRTVEIDIESVRLISEEESGECARSFPSVISFCSCKPLLKSMFSRLIF